MSIELSAFEISELLQKKMVADEVAKRDKWELKYDRREVRKSLKGSVLSIDTIFRAVVQ